MYVIRLIGGFLGASLIAGCTQMCSSPVPVKAEKISVLLNWTFYGEHAAFFVADEMGFFADEGLAVEILPGSGSGSTVKVIGSGAHEFGYAGAGTMLKAASVGVPVKAIAVVQQINPMAVIFRAESNIQDVRDLARKRIGITVGDANSQLLPALLKAHSMSRDDVELVSFPTPQSKEQALIDKKIDAFLGFFHDQPPRLQHSSDVKLKWLPYFSSGVNTLSSAVIAHRQKLLAQPERAKKFVRALQRALTFVRQNPEQAANIYFKYDSSTPVSLAEDMIRLSIPLQFTERSTGKPVGWSHPEDWLDTLNFLSQYAGLRSVGRPQEYYTNEFVEGVDEP